MIEYQKSAPLVFKIKVVFHLKKRGRLPFGIKLKSSSVFYLVKKKLRSSSLFKKNEVIFHISSSWVKIRFHTKNQLPRLPKTTQIVMIPGVMRCLLSGCAASYKAALPLISFFTDYNTTPTKVVVSCFGLLVGLWQY
jgi:hypothetical protein